MRGASPEQTLRETGAGVYLGLCAMLLCRCAMGEVLTVHGIPEFRRYRAYTSCWGSDKRAARSQPGDVQAPTSGLAFEGEY